MSLCPCCSSVAYEQCCQPFLNNSQVPQTPEQLMRSRYTAYSRADTVYIKKTMLGKPLSHFQEEDAKKWAQKAIWLSLEVIDVSIENPELGYVEFIARFLENQQVKSIHERSEFCLQNERWFYVDGVNKEVPPVKKSTKIARNSPCPCKSGRKFKNCHER